MRKMSSVMKNRLAMILLVGMCPFASYGQVGDEIITDEDRASMRALEIEESDTTFWDFGGNVGLNLNQSSFTNWAAGGQNAVATTAIASLYAKYRGKRSSWDTSLDLAFGLLSQDGKPWIKTDDRIDLISKYGYRVSRDTHWYISGLFNFRTQFRDGFEIADGLEVGDPISSWLSPAFSIFSLGAEYRPNKTFSFFISPTTTKLTVVRLEELRENFGVDVDRNARWEAGAYMRAEFRDDIFENVNLLTRLDLFSNYFNNPQNIDVNWEVLLTFKINKWLATSLTTQLIYDDDIVIGRFENAEGVVVTAGGPRTQFRQVFALGISVTL